MAKPELVKPTVFVKTPIRTHPPATRVIAERIGDNQYRVSRETYDCAPTRVEVIQACVSRVPAEDEVRIQLEEFLGLNRFGDSGL